MKYRKLIFGILSVALLNSGMVYADQIVVSGNGEGSNNNVNIAQTSTNNSSQTNQADINNNVNQTTDTGNNDANNNNGNASITTGDANASSNITNDNINQSYLNNQGCCQSGEFYAKISGNGEYSKNGITFNNGSSSNVSINNNANISNSVNGKANTGWNSASHNNGGASIDTGDINAKSNIKNKWINAYIVQASAGNGQSAYLDISGNAESSDNAIVLAQTNTTSVNIVNEATLNNEVNYDLNTGNNTADDNNGDVSIKTGDIAFDTVIDNGPINVGYVDVSCCEKEHGPTTPPTTPGTTNPGSGSGGGSGSTSGSSVATTVTGQVLPVTGNYLMLFLMIGNVMMLFLGGYLRLRSGRSPNLLLAH